MLTKEHKEFIDDIIYRSDVNEIQRPTQMAVHSQLCTHFPNDNISLSSVKSYMRRDKEYIADAVQTARYKAEYTRSIERDIKRGESIHSIRNELRLQKKRVSALNTAIEMAEDTLDKLTTQIIDLKYTGTDGPL